MKTVTYTLELLTPCFCAGANQAKAEIRASAIRGQLRWWFRTLGGNAAEERAIFGGVAGTASASSLIIRVLSIKSGPVWPLPAFKISDTESYVWYFAKASGDGVRWNSSGAIPPKSSFTLRLLQTRPLTSELQQKLDVTVQNFLQLGALGLRCTRGLGAFHCKEKPFGAATFTTLGAAGYQTEIRPGVFADANAVAREIGSLVKGTRDTYKWKADKVLSPLGNATPQRQTSAIYFRPVRASDGKSLQVAVFEAPHDRVLSPDINQQPIVGQTAGLQRYIQQRRVLRCFEWN